MRTLSRAFDPRVLPQFEFRAWDAKPPQARRERSSAVAPIQSLPNPPDRNVYSAERSTAFVSNPISSARWRRNNIASSACKIRQVCRSCERRSEYSHIHSTKGLTTKANVTLAHEKS